MNSESQMTGGRGQISRETGGDSGSRKEGRREGRAEEGESTKEH